MRVMNRDHSVLVDPRGPLWELEVGVRDASAAASPPPPTSMTSGHLQRKRGCAGPRPGEIHYASAPDSIPCKRHTLKH